VEEGVINRVLAEAGEEELAEAIEQTGGVDGIGAIEEVEAAIFSKVDPDSIDLSNKESIADMAIIMPILTIY